MGFFLSSILMHACGNSYKFHELKRTVSEKQRKKDGDLYTVHMGSSVFSGN